MAANEYPFIIKPKIDMSAALLLFSILNRALGAIATLSIKIDASSILQATKAAQDLQTSLSAAFNTANKEMDLSKFATNLQKQGQTIGGLQASLALTGELGKNSFMELTRQVVSANLPITLLGKTLNSFGDLLKRTVQWQLASSAIHGVIGTYSLAINYAKQLNESLTNIRIVTGQNIDQMAKFAKEANNAAKGLSSTTTRYTNASLIYYQQGLDDEEVKKRTDVTLKLANAAGISAEKASQLLTSIWNNFSKGSQNLEHYADVLVKLGAETASSSEEISRGMQKFAAVSNTVGLSYEYAASALATVTATTRESADTVGTAFRTLFSRLEGLKLGETLEDGTTVNKYSKALETVGVNIKYASGELKSMDTILNDLGARWKDLTKDQQVALAQTVGGARLYSTLIALMDNWDFFLKNLARSNSSDGTLLKLQDIYASSWEAASNRVRTSMENIFDSVIDDLAIIAMTNGFSTVLDTVGGVVDGLGGMKGILLTTAGILTTKYAKEIPNAVTNAWGVARSIFNPRGVRDLTNSTYQEFIDALEQLKLGASLSEIVKIEGLQRLLLMRQLYNTQSRFMTEAEKTKALLSIENMDMLNAHLYNNTLARESLRERYALMEVDAGERARESAGRAAKRARSEILSDEEQNNITKNIEELEKRRKQAEQDEKKALEAVKSKTEALKSANSVAPTSRAELEAEIETQNNIINAAQLTQKQNSDLIEAGKALLAKNEENIQLANASLYDAFIKVRPNENEAQRYADVFDKVRRGEALLAGEKETYGEGLKVLASRGLGLAEALGSLKLATTRSSELISGLLDVINNNLFDFFNEKTSDGKDGAAKTSFKTGLQEERGKVVLEYRKALEQMDAEDIDSKVEAMGQAFDNVITAMDGEQGSFTEALSGLTSSLKDAKAEIIDATDAEQQKVELLIGAVDEDGKANGALNDLFDASIDKGQLEYIEENTPKLEADIPEHELNIGDTVGKAVATITSAFGTMAAASQGWETLFSEDSGIAEKFGAVAGVGGSIAATAGSAASMLSSFGVAAAGPWGAAIGAISAIVGVVGPKVLQWLDDLNESEEERTERLQEEAKVTEQASLAMENRYETIKESDLAYRDSVDSLANLQKGTIEYASAALQINAEAYRIIKEGHLTQADYTYNLEKGIIEIDAEALRLAEQKSFEDFFESLQIAALAEARKDYDEIMHTAENGAALWNNGVKLLNFNTYLDGILKSDAYNEAVLSLFLSGIGYTENFNELFEAIGSSSLGISENYTEIKKVFGKDVGSVYQYVRSLLLLLGISDGGSAEEIGEILSNSVADSSTAELSSRLTVDQVLNNILTGFAGSMSGAELYAYSQIGDLYKKNRDKVSELMNLSERIDTDGNGIQISDRELRSYSGEELEQLFSDKYGKEKLESYKKILEENGIEDIDTELRSYIANRQLTELILKDINDELAKIKDNYDKLPQVLKSDSEYISGKRLKELTQNQENNNYVEYLWERRTQAGNDFMEALLAAGSENSLFLLSTDNNGVPNIANALNKYSEAEIRLMSGYVQTFTQDFGRLTGALLGDLFVAGSDELLSAFNNIDFTDSKLTNLYRLLLHANTIGIQGKNLQTDLRGNLDGILTLAIEDAGGTDGLFDLLYEESGFTEGLNKIIDNLGDISLLGADSILSLSDNIEGLNGFLHLTDVNAAGLAKTLQEVQKGTLTQGQVTSEFLNAMSRINSTLNSVAQVAKYISEFDYGTSVSELTSHYSKLGKTVQSSMKNGMPMDEPNLIAWKELFGENSMVGLMQDLADWRKNGLDVGSKFNEKYADEKKMIEDLQKDGDFEGVYRRYFKEQDESLTAAGRQALLQLELNRLIAEGSANTPYGQALANRLALLLTNGNPYKDYAVQNNMLSYNGKDLMEFDPATGRLYTIEDDETGENNFLKQFKTLTEFEDVLLNVFGMSPEMAKSAASDYAAHNPEVGLSWSGGRVKEELGNIITDELLYTGEDGSRVIDKNVVEAFYNLNKAFLDPGGVLGFDAFFEKFIQEYLTADGKNFNNIKTFSFDKDSQESMAKLFEDLTGYNLNDWRQAIGIEQISNGTVQGYNIDDIIESYDRLGVVGSKAYAEINDELKDNNLILTDTVQDAQGYAKVITTADEEYQNWLNGQENTAENFLNYIKHLQDETLIKMLAEAWKQAMSEVFGDEGIDFKINLPEDTEFDKITDKVAKAQAAVGKGINITVTTPDISDYLADMERLAKLKQYVSGETDVYPEQEVSPKDIDSNDTDNVDSNSSSMNYGSSWDKDGDGEQDVSGLFITDENTGEEIFIPDNTNSEVITADSSGAGIVPEDVMNKYDQLVKNGMDPAEAAENTITAWQKALETASEGIENLNEVADGITTAAEEAGEAAEGVGEAAKDAGEATEDWSSGTLIFNTNDLDKMRGQFVALTNSLVENADDGLTIWKQIFGDNPTEAINDAFNSNVVQKATTAMQKLFEGIFLLDPADALKVLDFTDFDGNDIPGLDDLKNTLRNNLTTEVLVTWPVITAPVLPTVTQEVEYHVTIVEHHVDCGHLGGTEGTGETAGEAIGQNHGAISLKYARGRKENEPYEGLAEVAEEGPELMIRNGQPIMLGADGENRRHYAYVQKDDIILTAAETRDVARTNPEVTKSRTMNKIPGFKRGSYGYGSEYDEDMWSKIRSAGLDGTGEGEDKWELERYHVITELLEDIADLLERISKIKDRSFGKTHIAMIDAETKALSELIKAQLQYISEIDNFYNEVDKKKLLDLGIWDELEFDPNGVITNYDELQEKYAKAAANGDKEAEKKWKAILQLEETNNLIQELIDLLTELAMQYLDMQLEKITAEVELDLFLSDDSLEYLDYMLNKATDEAYDAAEAISLIGQKTDENLKRSETLRNGISSILSNYHLDLDDISSITDENELKRLLLESGLPADAIEQIRKWRSELLTLNSELDNTHAEIAEKLSKAFKTLTGDIKDEINIFNHYNKVLETTKNISNLLGISLGKLAKALINDANRAMTANALNKLDSSRVYLNSLLESRSLFENAYNAAIATGDLHTILLYKEKMKEIDAEIRSANEDLLNNWQSTLELAGKILEEEAQLALQTFEEALSPVLGSLDALETAFGRHTEVGKNYLQDYDRLYELNKLNRDISKSIDDTDNLSNRKALMEMLAEINRLQKEGNKLSEYDIANLRRKYELELARLGVEEARNSKSMVTLSRDLNGNWGYVYTADEDEVATAEQEYEDKLHEMLKANDEYIEELQSKIIKLQKDCSASLAEIMTNTSLTDELRQAQITDLELYYESMGGALTQLLQTTLGNQSGTYNPMLAAYNTDNANLLDSFGETSYALLTGFSSIGLLSNTMNVSFTEMLASVAQSLLTYLGSINAANLLANVDISSLIVNAGNSSETTRGLVSELAETFTTAFSEITSEAANFESAYSSNIESCIEENENFVLSINDIIESLSMLLATTDPNVYKAALIYAAARQLFEAGEITEEEFNKARSRWEEIYLKSIGQWTEPKSNSTPAEDVPNNNFSPIQPSGPPIHINRDSDWWKSKLASDPDYKKALGAYQAAVQALLNKHGYTVARFSTGGYTGEWGESGKLAFLHEKELVLNKNDTRNLLDTIGMLKALEVNASTYLNTLTDLINLNNYRIYKDFLSSGAQLFITISAEFPNATDRNEIQEAFNNLINEAAQYANRK